MNLESMTIGEARKIAAIFGSESNTKPVPFKAGESYLIRTATVYALGRVREIVGDFLVLDDASYVASTGRFSEAMATGTLDEIERVPDGEIVNMNAICDAQPWHHELPQESK